jgi:RNA polymerase sigma-70 factor (ECF subfamily)
VIATIAAVSDHAEAWESRLCDLFKALSTRLGGRAEPLDEAEEQKLVGLARGGDRMASQRLYRQHVDRVYRTVRGMLSSDADAEDVTQDAMFTILTSLDRYSARSGVRFVAWVTTIALNTARRRFRRRRPEPTPSGVLPDLADEGVDLERDIDAAQRRAALLEGLATLESVERDVVSLRYGAELNASEIGRIVGLEPANVRKILERARARLRERIDTDTRLRGETR